MEEDKPKITIHHVYCDDIIKQYVEINQCNCVIVLPPLSAADLRFALF